jgi:DNA modification methylase
MSGSTKGIDCGHEKTIGSRYKLYAGDCLEVLKRLPEGSIDMVLCDPPYGTTDCKWDTVIPFAPFWEQLHRIAKPNAAICMFGCEPFSSILRTSNLKSYKYDWIWHKTQATGHLNAKKQPLREYENISVFYKSQCTYSPQISDKKKKNIRPAQRGPQPEIYGKSIQDSPRSIPDDKTYPRNVLKIPNCNRGEAGLHPTQKPVALLEYLIRTYTNEGETVLDPTMGSGSTGVACLNAGRKFIGIEREPEYMRIAEQRIYGF